MIFSSSHVHSNVETVLGGLVSVTSQQVTTTCIGKTAHVTDAKWCPCVSCLSSGPTTEPNIIAHVTG